MLLGDGAGAVAVTAGDYDLGLPPFRLGSDGAQAGLLYVDQDKRVLHMRGAEVYRHAVARMVEATETALRSAEIGDRGHRPLRSAPGQRSYHRGRR